jgi:hypothetical protein
MLRILSMGNVLGMFAFSCIVTFSDTRHAGTLPIKVSPFQEDLPSELWPYALPDSTFAMQDRGGALFTLSRGASLSIVCDNQFLH